MCTMRMRPTAAAAAAHAGDRLDDSVGSSFFIFLWGRAVRTMPNAGRRAGRECRMPARAIRAMPNAECPLCPPDPLRPTYLVWF